MSFKKNKNPVKNLRRFWERELWRFWVSRRFFHTPDGVALRSGCVADEKVDSGMISTSYAFRMTTVSRLHHNITMTIRNYNRQKRD